MDGGCDINSGLKWLIKPFLQHSQNKQTCHKEQDKEMQRKRESQIGTERKLGCFRDKERETERDVHTCAFSHQRLFALRVQYIWSNVKLVSKMDVV